MSEGNPSGAVHPSVLLLLWGVLGVGLHSLRPLDVPDMVFFGPLKVGLLVAGALLVVWSGLELYRHETTMEHKVGTTALVTSGPYRISRHPIYVGLILVLLAVSIDATELWFMILTVSFGFALQWMTVVREEAYLEREFGAEYTRYRKTVRQWI